MSIFDKDLKLNDIISVKSTKGFFIVTRVEPYFYQNWDTTLRTRHPSNPYPKEGDEYWATIFCQRVATSTGKPYKRRGDLYRLHYSASLCTKQDKASIQVHKQELIDRAERLHKHLLELV